MKIDRVRRALNEDRGVRETARRLKMIAGKVRGIKEQPATTAESARLIPSGSARSPYYGRAAGL